MYFNNHAPMFQPPEGVKLRHEWKHLITPADKAQIAAKLRTFCRPDGHYGPEGYRIRSLYFDNVYDKALAERLNGQEVREKFRIRFYNCDDSYIMLEKKMKFNQLCGKQSCRLTREEVERLLAGDISWLTEKGNPLCAELYAKMHSQLLRPKVMVDYHRQAFVYGPGNVRITIDEDVRTGLVSLDFFNPDAVLIPADVRRPIILEVKYDEYFPDIVRRAIQLDDRRTTNFSKYTAARLTNY